MKPVYLYPGDHRAHWYIVNSDGHILGIFHQTKPAVIKWLRQDCDNGWTYCGSYEDLCPNPEQLEALVRWKKAMGRRWRWCLEWAWSTGRYESISIDDAALLQQLRNNPAFGPEGLAKFKFGREQ